MRQKSGGQVCKAGEGTTDRVTSKQEVRIGNWVRGLAVSWKDEYRKKLVR